MSACVVHLYKDIGNKYQCTNFTGISLLSVLGKVCGVVLIKIIREGSSETAFSREARLVKTAHQVEYEHIRMLLKEWYV